MELRSNLALLTTGTLLNVVSQILVSLDFADKNAHIIPWVKYVSTLIPAACGRLRQARTTRKAGPAAKPPPPAVTRQQQLQLTLIGLLDVLAYTLFTLAYYSCGAALSSLLLAASAQVLTALSTRFLLKRRLNNGQWLGIFLIIAGLGVRGLPTVSGSGSDGSSSSGGVGLSPEQWVGAGMIVLSACLYSWVGIVYEQLTKGAARPPPHTEVLWHTSKIGFVVSSAYQLFYTLPRFGPAVRDRMAAAGVSPLQLLPLSVAFGVCFNGHMLAQGWVFRSDGAIGVGVVNSVRGAVLTVVTHALFCRPDRPWLCMTPLSALSAAVTTAGGVVWVLCDPKAQLEKRAGATGAAPTAAAAGAGTKEEGEAKPAAAAETKKEL